MATADFGHCVFLLQMRNLMSGLSQNHIGLTFVNTAADWRIFVRNSVLFALALQIVSV